VTLPSQKGRFVQGHPQVLRFAAVFLAIAGLGVGAVGCGGGDASGAAVSVYVAKPLCRGAQTELGAHGGKAGNFQVLIRCLAPAERAGRGVDLATNGSNSRRATEDTSSVATLELPNPGNKFARPILESAGVPLVISSSGQKGMQRIIKAVESSGSSEVRDKVREVLEPS
jgi:hypothetical protein